MRRFSDFEILYNELRDQNLGSFIPPIPPKSIATTWLEDGHCEIESRKRSLARFLGSITADKLSTCAVFKKFLTFNDEYWSYLRQRMIDR